MGTLCNFWAFSQGLSILLSKYLQKCFPLSHANSLDPEQFFAISVNKWRKVQGGTSFSGHLTGLWAL